VLQARECLGVRHARSVPAGTALSGRPSPAAEHWGTSLAAQQRGSSLPSQPCGCSGRRGLCLWETREGPQAHPSFAQLINGVQMTRRRGESTGLRHLRWWGAKERVRREPCPAPGRGPWGSFHKRTRALPTREQEKLSLHRG